MKLFYRNRVDEASVSCSSELSGFPAVNVQQSHLSMKWITTSPDDQYLLVDAGVGNTLTASMAAILSHNLTSGATVTISANATDAWGAPSFTQTFDASQELMLEEFTEIAYRFWRFDFDDPSNSDAYIMIGRLWLGTTLEIPSGVLVNFGVSIKSGDSVWKSVTSQRYADVGDKLRLFSLAFPPQEHAVIEQLRQMFDFVGNSQSLIVAVVDVRDWPIIDPCYVGIIGDFELKHHSNTKWVYSLNLEEDK